jgi:uncharacterized 2Fe-2S/4Fe-4S cluster protein (DUF4445 family)
MSGNTPGTDKLFKVTFLPAKKTAVVPEGTLLLDAAVQAGVLLDTPCGAQGRCGRCRVKVESGRVVQPDNPHLTSQQLAEGWVLSCIARVMGDVVLTVPAKKERERIAIETVASRAAMSLPCEWPHYPAVRRLFLKVPPPNLEDQSADWERLKLIFQKEHGISHLSLELPLLKQLPTILRESNWQVTATLHFPGDSAEARLIGLRPGRARGSLPGVAVDIGTTNVVVDLVDLQTGRIIDQASTRNKQISCGEDVISRIVYSQRGRGREELQRLVVETINELLQELAQKHKFAPTEIEEMVVAGNTIMTHFFLGLPARYIREEPYTPAAVYFPEIKAGELGLIINPLAPVYCVPSIAAYVGGDVTAGVLSSCLFQKEKLTLFLDVGTNGEIVLGNSEWMTSCACSAGPAFEGAGIRHGMRATTGAIEAVNINARTLEPSLTVIGNVPPLGICGSGMISAVAEMFLTGVIDRAGHIDVDYVQSKMGKKSRVRMGEHGVEYVLVWASASGTGEDIVLTGVDINNLLRTKAAIYAGIAVMMRHVGVSFSDIEEVLIGGAFGQHINIEHAIQIGLLPDLPWDRFKYLGNTSVAGAYQVLLSKYARAKCEEIAGKITYLELIADTTFMDELTGALFLPHTNIDNFPSVKLLLDQIEKPVAGTKAGVQ